MAVTVDASGTQTAVIGTEHTLDTIAGPGVYQFFVDTTNLAAGDVVELRVKKPVLNSGTVVTFMYGMFAGVQPPEDKGKMSDPFLVDGAAGACVVTLKQILGTGRAFPWSVLAT